MNPVAADAVPTMSGATRSDPACHAPPDAILECGPIVVQQLFLLVFSMTLCRSRRRQVVEMSCCRLICWAHNPKVGGSNPPPATNLKLHNINHLKPFAGDLQIHNRLPLRSH
jgi:hypothetical protein